MKEHKFRIYSKTLNKILTDDEIRQSLFSWKVVDDCVTLVSDDLIVLDYIGKKDKNGKEIYLGDITKRKDFDVLCVVVFENGRYYPKFMNTEKEGFAQFTDRDEVVGSIYENKGRSFVCTQDDIEGSFWKKEKEGLDWDTKDKLYSLIHHDRECLKNNCSWDETLEIIEQIFSSRKEEMKEALRLITKEYKCAEHEKLLKIIKEL